MKRNRVTIAALAVVALAGGIAAVVLMRGEPEHDAYLAAPATPTTARPLLTPAQERDRLDLRFHADPPDERWSPPLQRAAEGTLQAALPSGSSLRSCECRSSMCRAETLHPDLLHSQRFTRAAFLLPPPPDAPWKGASYSAPLDDRPSFDAPFVLVSFIMRRGPLPQ